MNDLSRFLADVGYDFQTCEECPPKLFTFQQAIMSEVPFDFLCDACRKSIEMGRRVCLRLEKRPAARARVEDPQGKLTAREA